MEPHSEADTHRPGLIVASPVVRVEGISRLVRTMREAEVDLDDLKDVTAAAGALAAAAIRPLVPVKTGRLVGSIRSNKAARRSTVAVGRARLPYAGPVHWGWPAHGIEPNEFGPEGLQRAEPAITALYLEGIDRILDNVKGV